MGQYDHDALYELATRTHSPFIHLQTQDDFKQIYQYLHSIQFEQTLNALPAYLDPQHTTSSTISASQTSLAPTILLAAWVCMSPIRLLNTLLAYLALPDRQDLKIRTLTPSHPMPEKRHFRVDHGLTIHEYLCKIFLQNLHYC